MKELHARNPLLIMISLLFLAALACQAPLGGNDNESTESTSVPVATVPESASGEGLAGPLSVFNLGPENNFGEPVDVDSYRLSLEIRFEETDPDTGETRTGRILAEGARVVDPPATSLVFSGEGDADFGQSDSFTLYQIEGTDYVSLGDGQCISTSAGPSGFLNPYDALLGSGGFLGSLQGATLAEEGVEINGVTTNHYTFSEDALHPADPTTATIVSAEGDVYVTQDGGHIVRATLTGQGGSSLFTTGEVTDGTIFYQLDYFDFDAPIVIEPPDGCLGFGGDDEFPILEDATQVASFSGTTTYNTDTPLEDIVGFYKAEMAVRGWDLDSEVSQAGIASLSFKQDGRQVQINAVSNPLGGGFIVTITES